MYVFPNADGPEGDNILYEIHHTVLTVFSGPHETLGAVLLHHCADVPCPESPAL